MDDPTRRALPGTNAADAPEQPAPERLAVMAKLDDLGNRLVINAHGYWTVPDGWTEADLRSLAGQLGVSLEAMAHMAVTGARGPEAGSAGLWDAGVPRFDFQARDASDEIGRMRKADHAAGKIARPVRCRARGCQRMLARPRLNRDAAGGVELVLIGRVALDVSAGIYVFGAGRPSRASDIQLLEVGPGHTFDPGWNIEVQCSCGRRDTLHVGRVLQEFARMP